jgi:hypothetical protein
LVYRPTTFVLNQNFQIAGVFKLQNSPDQCDQVMQSVKQIPVFAPPQIATRQAPVLLIPNVLDRTFCQHLIHCYQTDGGRDSGFMRQIDGKTVEVFDPEFKRRRDLLLQEDNLLQQLNTRIDKRIKPEIEKVFQFTISRFERYLVSCYDAYNSGFLTVIETRPLKAQLIVDLRCPLISIRVTMREGSYAFQNMAPNFIAQMWEKP